MSDITAFTERQKEIERLITNMGFRVRAEVDCEQYRVDLAISDFDLAIEIDGPSHRAVKKTGEWITLENARSKRDLVVLRCFENGIYHVPVWIDDEVFEEKLSKIIGEIQDEWNRRGV